MRPAFVIFALVVVSSPEGFFAESPWCRCLASGIERGASGDHSDVIVTGVPPSRGSDIARRAIALKHRIQETLFSATDSRPWVPPCTIHVHPDRASFVRVVRGAPPGVEGATSIEFLGDVVCRRRIDVLESNDGGIPGALAHELAHVVLADRFRDRPPPRWADEGIATLFDSPAKQRGHDSDFRAALDHGRSWRLADLMAIDREPADSTRLRVFYGQSAAVVRWLLARSDGPTLFRFLEESDSDGITAAVRRHYGLESLAELEKAWLETPADIPEWPAEQTSEAQKVP